jgi:hypothetical protein
MHIVRIKCKNSGLLHKSFELLIDLLIIHILEIPT